MFDLSVGSNSPVEDVNNNFKLGVGDDAEKEDSSADYGRDGAAAHDQERVWVSSAGDTSECYEDDEEDDHSVSLPY